MSELPPYQGRDAHLAPAGIVELRFPDGVYLADVGDEDRQRVFGWYYGYPVCCVDWFVAGWNDPIPPAPRTYPPHHPVSGHLMCPACVAGPPAPLPYRPARHFGWVQPSGLDDDEPEFHEPCDYDWGEAEQARVADPGWGEQLEIGEAPAP